jgi:hypothetical protein
MRETDREREREKEREREGEREREKRESEKCIRISKRKDEIANLCVLHYVRDIKLMQLHHDGQHRGCLIPRLPCCGPKCQHNTRIMIMT